MESSYEETESECECGSNEDCLCFSICLEDEIEEEGEEEEEEEEEDPLPICVVCKTIIPSVGSSEDLQCEMRRFRCYGSAIYNSVMCCSCYGNLKSDDEEKNMFSSVVLVRRDIYIEEIRRYKAINGTK